MQNAHTMENVICYPSTASQVKAEESLRLPIIPLAPSSPELKRYKRSIVTKQVAWGFFTGISGAFLAVIVQSLIQANYLLALGLLGPTLAAFVGVWRFSHR